MFDGLRFRHWGTELRADGVLVLTLDRAEAPALGSTVYVTPKALSHAGTPAIKLPTTALRPSMG